ncbi:hypothetical protein ACVGWG_02805, partial [Enterobacter asburiae]
TVTSMRNRGCCGASGWPATPAHPPLTQLANTNCSNNQKIRVRGYKQKKINNEKKTRHAYVDTQYKNKNIK